jgi:polyphosphate kinase 2 (PPK2 family)
VVLKFFHVSKKEQKARLLGRLENRTATKRAPWYVVPADNKWFTRAVVAAGIVNVLSDLDLDYPEIDRDRLEELVEARQLLEKQ